MDKPWGEIITSSLTSWEVCSWDQDLFPDYGALVATRHENTIYYGIIINSTIQSIYSSGPPITYQQSPEQLKQTHPELSLLFKTVLTCLPIGFAEDISILYQLPARPPKIHTIVKTPTNTIIKAFFSNPSYIRLLHTYLSQPSQFDEIILAIIHCLEKNQLMQPPILQDILHTLAMIMGNEYNRIRFLLERINALQKSKKLS
jgi:hypothetical protein